MSQEWVFFYHSNCAINLCIYFQRGQNPRLSHVLNDLDFDERPNRRGKNHDDDDDDEDLCAMMDRLPAAGNKRRWIVLSIV